MNIHDGMILEGRRKFAPVRTEFMYQMFFSIPQQYLSNYCGRKRLSRLNHFQDDSWVPSFLYHFPFRAFKHTNTSTSV